MENKRLHAIQTTCKTCSIILYSLALARYVTEEKQSERTLSTFAHLVRKHTNRNSNKNMQKISKYVSLLFVVLWHCVAHVDAIRCYKAIYVDASTYSKRWPKETERCRNSWKRVSKRVRNMDMEKKPLAQKSFARFLALSIPIEK